MKYRLSVYTVLLFCSLSLNAQTTNKPTEFELIAATIQDYMDGTANGDPEKIKESISSRFQFIYGQRR